MENKSPDGSNEDLPMKIDHEHMMHQGHTMPPEHAQHESLSKVMPNSSHNMSEMHAGHEQHASHEEGHEHAEHQMAHADHTGHEQMFRQRFWVSLILTVPVLLFSSGFQELLGFTLPAFPGSQWIAPAFSLAIFIYGGLPFLRLAGPEIKKHQPGMMTLISLAISIAFLYSFATLFIPGQMDFFWELATLIDIMLLGHWIEMRSIRQASGALNALAKLMPDTAERIGENDAIEFVPVQDLQKGDLVLVRPGANIPADGVIVEGESAVNEAMLTGESKPVSKKKGSSVLGGSINGDGSLRIQVTATGNETALAGIMRLVEQAQQSKSATQVLADRAAGWLFYISIGIAVITALVWSLAVGFNVTVLERVATVLVTACPHALGLAIPLVVQITTTLGASNGILIRDRLALEKLHEIDTVIFDKTGTLTEGRFGVVGIKTAANLSEEEALALAAAVEGDSEHSIAKGIRTSAEKRHIAVPHMEGFEALKGRGAVAQDESHKYYIGGSRLLDMLNLTLPEQLASFESEASSKGETVVHLVRANLDGNQAEVLATYAVDDVIRPESQEALNRLREMGIQVAMLTGDSQAVAKSVASQLGIDTYFAQILPEEKENKVQQLQAEGKKVAMVGDGVNDAPALTRADVGIAIGSGTDVAVESAGIILVQNNPLDVVKAIELSKASYNKMIQNLVWATGYNVIALPLAAGALAPVGLVLSPAVGAILMSLSTIIVAINAQLLRKAKI
jgi:Cu2+-exporting ATPase